MGEFYSSHVQMVKTFPCHTGDGAGKSTEMLEIDIVMSSLLFMLITYYSVMTDTNEHDWHSLDIFLLFLLE